MANNYFISEPAEEILNAVRSSQQTVVEAVRTWVDSVKSVTPNVPAAQLPLADLLPQPEEFVASAYDFAEKLLASQRQFAGELVKAAAPLLPGSDSQPAPAASL